LDRSAFRRGLEFKQKILYVMWNVDLYNLYNFYTKRFYVLWHDAWTPEVCSQGSTAETSVARQRLAETRFMATENNRDSQLFDLVIYIRSS
jgi:hypothetical protein